MQLLLCLLTLVPQILEIVLELECIIVKVDTKYIVKYRNFKNLIVAIIEILTVSRYIKYF